MELLERGDREGAEAVDAVRVEVPVAVDDQDPAPRLKAVEHGAQPRRSDAHPTGQRGHPHAGRPGLSHVLRHHVLVASRGEQIEMSHQGGGLAPDAGGIDVEEGAPADGDDGRVGANDEPIARHRHHWLLQPYPHDSALTRGQLGAIQQQDAGHDLGGPGVEAHPVARLERPRRLLEELQRAVDEGGGHQGAGQPQHVAALDRGPLQRL